MSSTEVDSAFTTSPKIAKKKTGVPPALQASGLPDPQGSKIENLELRSGLGGGASKESSRWNWIHEKTPGYKLREFVLKIHKTTIIKSYYNHNRYGYIFWLDDLYHPTSTRKSLNFDPRPMLVSSTKLDVPPGLSRGFGGREKPSHDLMQPCQKNPRSNILDVKSLIVFKEFIEILWNH